MVCEFLLLSIGNDAGIIHKTIWDTTNIVKLGVLAYFPHTNKRLLVFSVLSVDLSVSVILTRSFVLTVDPHFKELATGMVTHQNIWVSTNESHPLYKFTFLVYHGLIDHEFLV